LTGSINLGYYVPNINLPRIEVYIKDLPKKSNIKVRTMCVCGKINTIPYSRYTNSLEKYGYCTCKGKCSSDKVKKTSLEKYGTEHPTQSNKVKENNKQTNLEKYGVSSYSKTDEFLNKYKQTNLKKYGVEHVSQSKEIHLKQQKSGLKRKQYLNTVLYYQGTYEKDFLDKYINILDINNGPTIKYNFKDKNKIYFSDFYIESKNIIVEIKSDYTYNLHLEKNLSKQKYCIEQGYDFIFIINKDYSELNKKIKDNF